MKNKLIDTFNVSKILMKKEKTLFLFDYLLAIMNNEQGFYFILLWLMYYFIYYIYIYIYIYIYLYIYILSSMIFLDDQKIFIEYCN